MRAHHAAFKAGGRQTTMLTRYAIAGQAARGVPQIAIAFLRTNRVRVLEWPPLSPDLSPIENLWAELKRRVDECAPTTAVEVERHAKRIWRQLTTNRALVGSLFGSMQSRLEEVVRNNGGKTRF